MVGVRSEEVWFTSQTGHIQYTNRSPYVDGPSSCLHLHRALMSKCAFCAWEGLFFYQIPYTWYLHWVECKRQLPYRSLRVASHEVYRMIDTGNGVCAVRFPLLSESHYDPSYNGSCLMHHVSCSSWSHDANMNSAVCPHPYKNVTI